ADHRTLPALARNGLEILGCQVLASARLEELLPARDDPELGDDEQLGSQHGEGLPDVGVQPGDHGDDGDDRHHAEDHSQESQEGPQLVRAQRRDGDAKDLQQAHDGSFWSTLGSVLSTRTNEPSFSSRRVLNGPVTISSPPFSPDGTSISSSPVMPVTMGTNFAFPSCTTNTPSSSLGFSPA